MERDQEPPVYQNASTLHFINERLECEFRQWYRQKRLYTADLWGTSIDVILHVITVLRNKRRSFSYPYFLLSFPFALLHLYLLVYRARSAVKHRRIIIAGRRLLVGLLAGVAFSVTVSAVDNMYSVLRNLFGSTGIASLLLLSVQFRETFVLSTLYSLVNTWLFMWWSKTDDICTELHTSEVAGMLVNNLAQLMNQVESVVVLSSTFVHRVDTTAGITWQSQCRAVIHSLQVVVGFFLCTLLCYVLEQRSRQTFILQWVPLPINHPEPSEEVAEHHQGLLLMFEANVFASILPMVLSISSLVLAVTWMMISQYHGV